MKTKLLFVLLLCSFLFLTASCASPPSVSCRLTDGERVVLDKRYSVDFPTALRLKIRGGIAESFKKSGMTEKDFLKSVCPSLAADVEQCCMDAYLEKREPTMEYSGEGTFRFTEGRAGRAASENEVAARLIEGGGSFDGALPVRSVFPVLTVDDLKKNARKTAFFSCRYDTSSENRKRNIALAVEKLDNLTVEAGETLSFNETVGERTKANGFLDAVVIENGVFAPGVGGGVCQVSTALYNAWIRAGLGARSKNHSLPVSYVPPGTDAMVSQYNDLVLINDSDYPVFLDGDCDGTTLSFTLYGTDTGVTVDVVGQLVALYPCDEYEIVFGDEDKVLSQPKDGSLYVSYRDFYRDGRLLRREKLRTSEYKKTKGKKIVKKQEADE